MPSNDVIYSHNLMNISKNTWRLVAGWPFDLQFWDKDRNLPLEKTFKMNHIWALWLFRCGNASSDKNILRTLIFQRRDHVHCTPGAQRNEETISLKHFFLFPRSFVTNLISQQQVKQKDCKETVFPYFPLSYRKSSWDSVMVPLDRIQRSLPLKLHIEMLNVQQKSPWA